MLLAKTRYNSFSHNFTSHPFRWLQCRYLHMAILHLVDFMISHIYRNVHFLFHFQNVSSLVDVQFIEIINWCVVIYNLVSIPKSNQSLYMFIKSSNNGRHIVIIIWGCFSWNTLVSVLLSPIIIYTRKYIFLFIDKNFISKLHHNTLLPDNFFFCSTFSTAIHHESYTVNHDH